MILAQQQNIGYYDNTVVRPEADSLFEKPEVKKYNNGQPVIEPNLPTTKGPNDPKSVNPSAIPTKTMKQPYYMELDDETSHQFIDHKVEKVNRLLWHVTQEVTEIEKDFNAIRDVYKKVRPTTSPSVQQQPLPQNRNVG